MPGPRESSPRRPPPASFAEAVLRGIAVFYVQSTALITQRILTLQVDEEVLATLVVNFRLGSSSIFSRTLTGGVWPRSDGAVTRQPELDWLQERQQHHMDDGHLWGAPDLMYFPWSYGDAPSNGSSSESGASASAATPTSALYTGASSRQLPPPPTPPDLSLLRLHDLTLALQPRLAALLLLLHSAAALQTQLLAAVTRQAAHAADTAEQAWRSMPPPHAVPELVFWSATAAAVHVEESLALALARTAGAASAAAAGVPAVAAAVTGSAAVAAATAAAAAPHLPLLRAARQRLLTSSSGLLGQLRSLQRGCTTHVLLRFMLFSALAPGLRRELLVRLDALAARACQLALLQEQHDAWLARLPSPPGSASSLHSSSHSFDSGPAGSAAGAVGPAPAQLQGGLSGSGNADAAADPALAPAPLPAALSARWYRSVFAPEMQACARQMSCEAPVVAAQAPAAPVGQGAAPAVAEAACDDGAAADPPGRFDLRDLYRLIRVLEVAVEDLQRYD